MRNRPQVCTDEWYNASKVTRANIGNNVRNFCLFVKTPSQVIKKLCEFTTFMQLARGSLSAYHGKGGSYGIQKVMAMLRILAKDPRNHKLWPSFVLFSTLTHGKYLDGCDENCSHTVAAFITEYPEDVTEDFTNFLRLCEKNDINPVTWNDEWCDNLVEILDDQLDD